MSKIINSPIFGAVKKATEDVELTEIQNIVSKFPVDVFQQLNRELNKFNLCILIDIKKGA